MMKSKSQNHRKNIVIVFIGILVLVLCGALLVFVNNKNEKIAELNHDVETKAKIIDIYNRAVNTQNTLDRLLEHVEKLSNVSPGTFWGDIVLDENYRKSSSVQTALKECTDVTFNQDLANEVKKISQDSVFLQGDDETYIRSWIANAGKAAGGTCMLSWYVINDTDYIKALESSDSIDPIKGRLNILKEEYGKDSAQLDKIKQSLF